MSEQISEKSNAQIALNVGDLPVWITEFELTEPTNSELLTPEVRTDGKQYRKARVLVRLAHRPLGYVVVDLDKLEPEVLGDVIWSNYSSRINEYLKTRGQGTIDSLDLKSGLSPIDATNEPRPFISVVMCTRDRPEGAIAVIEDLLKLEYEPFEIILVDNAPSSDATQEAAAARFGNDERVRYVRESRPGLSCARNRGWAEAKGEIVAYTDDDVSVDKWWLQGIAAGFARIENVGCVTGLIPSSEVENEVQLYFDQRVTWGYNCVPRIFDMNENRPESSMYPFAAGLFGAGANFAFRREALVKVGGFDEALGAGALAGGGEDLDAFVQVLLNGYRIVYEPSAIIHHIHRAEIDKLGKQMAAYGSGLSAFVFEYMFSRKTGPKILKGIPAGVVHALKFSGKSGTSGVLPPSMTLKELQGMAKGPFLYWKARRGLTKSVRS